MKFRLLTLLFAIGSLSSPLPAHGDQIDCQEAKRVAQLLDAMKEQDFHSSNDPNSKFNQVLAFLTKTTEQDLAYYRKDSAAAQDFDTEMQKCFGTILPSTRLIGDNSLPTQPDPAWLKRVEGGIASIKAKARSLKDRLEAPMIAKLDQNSTFAQIHAAYRQSQQNQEAFDQLLAAQKCERPEVPVILDKAESLRDIAYTLESAPVSLVPDLTTAWILRKKMALKTSQIFKDLLIDAKTSPATASLLRRALRNGLKPFRVLGTISLYYYAMKRAYALGSTLGDGIDYWAISRRLERMPSQGALRKIAAKTIALEFLKAYKEVEFGHEKPIYMDKDALLSQAQKLDCRGLNEVTEKDFFESASAILPPNAITPALESSKVINRK